MMKKAEVDRAIAMCNRCGFCQVACPTFRATGHEAGVARGRLALLRALSEDRLEWSPDLEEPLFACLLCGACTTNCFPAVPTADLVVDAREAYLEKVGRKRLHKLLFEELLPYPNRLRRAARAVSLGKNTGLSRVARALGLLRIFGRDFPKSEEIIGKMPGYALRERFEPGTLEGRGQDLSIGYFVGCGMEIMNPVAAEASLDLLRETAGQVHVLDNRCCGLPAWSYGDRRAAGRLARENLEILASGPFDRIVTDCSSCASFLKKYPDQFAEGDPLHGQAKAAASKVRDMVELVRSIPLPPLGGGEPVVVTYHDPCHASRGQGLVREPREILRSLPGVEYRELPEADWCCGGAGSYALSHFEIAVKVLERKIDNVEKTGANVLATSCPACIVQLSYGVRKRGLPVHVCHLSELLRDRLPGLRAPVADP
jgi:glycolate oxidase iron-sulfur subunit